MAKITVEYEVKCKRCNKSIAYSGAMYEKMKQYGHSRPEYCEDCRRLLIAERLTMGAAYYALRLKEGADESAVLPGELGKVYHPERPHVRVERPQKFEASKFGATPDKIVEIYDTNSIIF